MEKLTAQEEEVMQIVWKIKEGYIKDFLGEMTQPIPYTTLASIVKNLEKKKFLTSKKIANAFIYKPKINTATYQKYIMENMVHNYFDNSYKNLVNFFVSNEKIDANELEDLINIIKKGKK